MASSQTLISLLLLLLILLPLTTSYPSPPSSILLAAETLANSGFSAMSLTLTLAYPFLPLPPSSISQPLTIFSPPNSAFSSSGQPSLSHLLLHFSPLSLSPSSLSSLHTFPSLSDHKRLSRTSSNDAGILSIDDVNVSKTPLYDDGLVFVYSIDDFFEMNFTDTTRNETVPSTGGNKCGGVKIKENVFSEVSGVLKSRGYSIIGSFLDLQIIGFEYAIIRKNVGVYYNNGGGDQGNRMWTVFAPVDEDLVEYSGDFLGYSSLFFRHLVPCRFTWSDLYGKGNGSLVGGSLERGVELVVTRDGDGKRLMVNGVDVVFPDMFVNDWLVVHGIRGVIGLPNDDDEGMELREVKSKKKKKKKMKTRRVEKDQSSVVDDRAEF